MLTRQQGRSRSVVPLLAGLVVGALVSGVGVATGAVPTAAPTFPVAQPAAATRPAAPPPDAPAAEPAAPVDRVPACATMVASLPARDRLAQRLMVGVNAADPRAAAETVRASQVGGVFLGGNATALLRNSQLTGLQAMARVPVAVAVDDEGGRVQRVDDLDGSIPSARTMAKTMTVEQVREAARKRGAQLRARGVTWNLAPTVDVSDQAANSVIGDRSFSDDPDVVTRYAAAWAEGQREAGVFGVLKHFPGHGHADGDSHRGRVTTPPLARLRADDLRPYAELLGPAGALRSGGVGVMVGHLDTPGLTDGLPSSLTPAVYRLLRDEYGFGGLVVTDDLGAMKAITGQFPLPRATVRALQAGADMALSSNVAPVAPVLDALQQALADGRISAVDNDRAVARILAAKGVCAAS
ncbi:glycoside hydrolase family 3 N-terminal domain-containing protein [Pseudonocardia sp. H11422]|uniref:glycoside hydrolase family 3 N-terminal domain-containing protein n=1 Tax=Pseudonocardia sp. H11422 TaxID=2835866 RepID=UPI001BDC9CA3|nr:glycoside hydrolase family 3 N-terminal domain-containing protein [Pseudonocardia sp. H11422]